MQLPKLPTAPGQELKFATPLGRAVYNAVFNEKPSDVSQSFLARRLAFVYELDEDNGTDVPTTLRRSLADCPPVSSAHASHACCCQDCMLARHAPALLRPLNNQWARRPAAVKASSLTACLCSLFEYHASSLSLLPPV